VNERGFSDAARVLALLGGTTLTWPIRARSQQHSVRVIGFLSAESFQLDGVRLAGLRQGLKESGYVEGRNLGIEYRGVEGRSESLPALAADLIHHPVSVIVPAGIIVALAAKAMTTTVPIVFVVSGDAFELSLWQAFIHRAGMSLAWVRLGKSSQRSALSF
jgi:putative ABC transport system substrate-binding protein